MAVRRHPDGTPMTTREKDAEEAQEQDATIACLDAERDEARNYIISLYADSKDDMAVAIANWLRERGLLGKGD